MNSFKYPLKKRELGVGGESICRRYHIIIFTFAFVQDVSKQTEFVNLFQQIILDTNRGNLIYSFTKKFKLCYY